MNELKPFKTILYATNLGDRMRPVFRHALNMARIHHAKIIMLHAVAPIGSTGQAILSMYLPDKQVHDIEQESLNQLIDTMRERLKNYCAEEDDFCKDKDSLIDKIVVSPGNPAHVINHYAEAHAADLIVIGSHTRHANDHTMLGSTARTVTQHSKVPVLIIPNGE
ncbi:universal stress protein [Thiothrix litoralis]|jgi:nucleotide-binding universal stress UspA family protein|uniref:Universal stress protein n=1 Tax=Thiothrix litoralis TaxID=2891210 RepID=A0ABX7WRH4_9GAMM|nr:universal stress protein [Thiothrix litoralis]QTR45587.1 universal stress protein [Thiothrix litoralis]